MTTPYLLCLHLTEVSLSLRQMNLSLRQMRNAHRLNRNRQSKGSAEPKQIRNQREVSNFNFNVLDLFLLQCFRIEF